MFVNLPINKQILLVKNLRLPKKYNVGNPLGSIAKFQITYIHIFHIMNSLMATFRSVQVTFFVIIYKAYTIIDFKKKSIIFFS